MENEITKSTSNSRPEKIAAELRSLLTPVKNAQRGSVVCPGEALHQFKTHPSDCTYHWFNESPLSCGNVGCESEVAKLNLQLIKKRQEYFDACEVTRPRVATTVGQKAPGPEPMQPPASTDAVAPSENEDKFVRIGQVWIDTDLRRGLRLLEVEAIALGRAACKVITTGKKTRISTRCLPWSKKYKLLLDVVDEEPAKRIWTRRLPNGFQVVSRPDK